MKKLFILPAARADILEQYAYFLKQDLLEIAPRFLDCIQKSFLQIFEMPGIGSLRSFDNTKLKELRSWPVSEFKDIRIYYQVMENHINVVRVLHGKRNVKAIMEES